jgi:release factor glutamine methyltransferase
MIALPAAPARSIRQLRMLARDILKAAGLENAEREADWLLAHALRLSQGQLLATGNAPLTTRQAEQARTYIDRRAAREPLQYILGTQEFGGLEIAVTPDVLIPRPETTLLVEEAAQAIGAQRRSLVADVGTGSGCIAIAVAKTCPHATLWATDISWPALVVARRNALQHDVGKQVKFVQADLLGPFAASDEGIFDAIVSNPPYIPEGEMEGLQPEVSRYEPRLALAAGADGMTYYSRLLSAAAVLLKPAGCLIVELGIGQFNAVRALVDRTRLSVLHCRKDQAGIERALVLRRLD